MGWFYICQPTIAIQDFNVIMCQPTIAIPSVKWVHGSLSTKAMALHLLVGHGHQNVVGWSLAFVYLQDMIHLQPTIGDNLVGEWPTWKLTLIATIIGLSCSPILETHVIGSKCAHIAFCGK